ncbi:MAG: TolC family protein [Clostridia bacterium]|nr:TolC family protein [Clostridia bacterium]
MLRKILSILTAVVIVTTMFSASFAKTEDTEITEDKETIMTLDEAIDYAMAHNPNIVDLKRMERDQEVTYRKAIKAYNVWHEQKGFSFDYPTQYLEYYGYSKDLAKIVYDNFVAGENTAKSTVKYSVMKLAYTIDELEDTINLLEKTIEKQENDIKVAEVKLKINMGTLLDVESARTTLKSTKLQLETVKSTYDTLKVSIKGLLGFDVSKELKITIPESEFEYLIIEDVNKEIENSLATNSTILSAKLEYKQKEINNVLAKTLQLESTKAVKDAKTAFSDAELRLNNTTNSVKENLLILYRQIKTNESSVLVAKEELDTLNQKQVQMATMYDLNMLTKNDYESFKIAVLNAENTYKKALHENILLNERWEIAMLVGDVVSNV